MPTTTAGFIGHRCRGTWRTIGTIEGTVEARVWHALRHLIAVRILAAKSGRLGRE